MNTDMKTLGDEIRERVRVRMAVLGISTTAELATKMAMSRANASAFLKSLPQVGLPRFLRLADALEVRGEWLLAGELRDAVPRSVETSYREIL